MLCCAAPAFCFAQGKKSSTGNTSGYRRESGTLAADRDRQDRAAKDGAAEDWRCANIST